VIGSASDIVGVWIEPVIAQLMMILLAMVAASLSPVRYQLIFPRRRQHRTASRGLW
jgi:hypothetical protein